MYRNAKSSIICSNQGVEATQIPISDEWINRMRYIHLTECYSDIKWIANMELLSSTGNATQYSVIGIRIWEKNLRKSRCMYMYNWITLMDTCQHCKSTILQYNFFLKFKHLVIKMTKEEKDLYAENYKTLVKKTEADSKKSKAIPCSWITKLILL